MSKWDGVIDVVKQVAPGLATGLGGPLAGAATTFILRALGKKEGEDDAAIDALKADPNAILALKTAEIEFQKFLKQADVDLYKADAADRASARSAAVTVGMAPQNVLAGIYTLGYLGMMLGLLHGELKLPADAGLHDLFAGLISIMTLAQGQILSFYFGSSSGSQRKDDTIKAMAT